MPLWMILPQAEQILIPRRLRKEIRSGGAEIPPQI
jgi:hypothetical protein